MLHRFTTGQVTRRFLSSALGRGNKILPSNSPKILPPRAFSSSFLSSSLLGPTTSMTSANRKKTHYFRPTTKSTIPSILAHRLFSSAPKELPVKILYASQGGTAQIFAMQLSEALEEVAPGLEVTIQGLNEDDPSNLLQPGKAFHVFLASTTGVGEPPDNARSFNEWLTKETEASSDSLSGLDFCVFGLGNQKAHPNHYNVMGKGLDKKLGALGANRVLPLGLGDDGECIEDDYDTWMEGLLDNVYRGNAGQAEPEQEAAAVEEKASSAAVVEDPNVTFEPCQEAKCPGGSRLISAKYERLQLTPSGQDMPRDDLFHLTKSFYMENTEALPVLTNRPLNTHAEENGLREMRVSIEHTNMSYETGDHLMVYPQNSEAMVEGFLFHMDVDRHVTIDAPEGSTKYPHPTGITLMETLQHCVDLGAVPSPNVTRLLTGRSKIDYKNEIANPRRTVLDLLANAPRKFALEEILYNLSPMKPRYYSIASSNIVNPKEVSLVYRPVQYTSSQGHLRLGTSTTYLKNMMGCQDSQVDDYNTTVAQNSSLIAVVNSNPTFRLPQDPKTPVLFIAGGCGVAPIRAFLEERIHQASQHKHNPFGEGYLFLGFRSPADAPYKALVQKAFQCGAISNLHITYNFGCDKGLDQQMLGDLEAHTSCGLVSDAVGEYGEPLYSFFERQGHTFICGGARLFGVAIENQVHELLQKHGNVSEDEATQYLQRLLEEGRFNEDLSD